MVVIMRNELTASYEVRHGSLIYKKLVLVFCAVCMASVGFAATRWWHPSVMNSSNRYLWNNASNWLDDNGMTGEPQTGDTVVLTNKTSVWSIPNTTLHAFILRPQAEGQGLSGTGPRFAAGALGIRLEVARTVSYWLSLVAPDNYDLPIYVCNGGTLSMTENYSGNGRFLKQGTGTMIIGTKAETTRFKWHGTVVEAGTLQMGGNDMQLTGHDLEFSGENARILLAAKQTLKDADFHETVVTPGLHSIEADSSLQMIFTGTPVRQPTVFTGRFAGYAGVAWSPDSADSTFVISNSTSTTAGKLTVSNGTVRLSGGATFVSLGTLEVAAGGTFEVESGSGTGFRTGMMTLESGATLALGDGVKILATAATYAGNALADGTYTSADGVGVTGNGVLVVRTATPAATSAVWTGGGETTSVLDPANWGVETLPALYDGSLVATFAGSGSTATLGTADGLDFLGWNLSGGFTFAAAEGAGYVELETGGMSAPDAAADTAYTLGWPLMLHGAQTWTLGQNNTLDVNAPISGGGQLTVNGKARVNFNAPSTYTGDVLLTNGTFYITATNAVGAAGGTLKFTPGYGTLHFGGQMALDRPFTAIQTAHNDYAKMFVDAGATVDFNRKVYFASKQRGLDVGSGAVCRFHGGFTADTCCALTGSGTVVVDGTPVEFKDRFYLRGQTWELHVANNKINGNVGDWSSGKVKTCVPYALRHEFPTSGTYQRIYLNGATIDLCGNDQSIGLLGGRGGTITSATPATFHLVDNYANTEVQFINGCRQTNSVPFTGAVSFAKEGCLNYWLKGTSTTCGDLSVTNGTLTLLPDASWANASNVNVSCAGTLKVQNKEAFGTHAVLHVDGADARVELDYAGRMRVYGLYVNGVKQALGVYGGAASGAPKKLSCFGDDGAGHLVVYGEGFGTVIVVR